MNRSKEHNMTKPQPKNSKIYNFAYHNYILRLPDFCRGIEKKTVKDMYVRQFYIFNPKIDTLGWEWSNNIPYHSYAIRRLKTSTCIRNISVVCVTQSTLYDISSASLVCLFVVFRPRPEFLTHMKTSPLPMKDCKF